MLRGTNSRVETILNATCLPDVENNGYRVTGY